MTRRLLPLATLSAFVLAVAPAVAGSTVKPKSGTYKGTLTAPRTEYAVTLTVSGGKLTKATVSNIPLYCSSGGPAIPVKFGGSKIALRERGVLDDRQVHDQGRPLQGQGRREAEAVGALHVERHRVRGARDDVRAQRA